MFTYDAYVNDTYILSFLDGDLWRLFRFREAAIARKGKFYIICFHEQVNFLQSYLGECVSIGTISISKVERLLGIRDIGAS